MAGEKDTDERAVHLEEHSEVEIDEKHTLRYVDVNNTQAFKGDDSDGEMEFTLKTFITCVSIALMYTGSQLLLYFVGGNLKYMQEDIGFTAGEGWIPVANTLATAVVSPFAGYLEDVFGRRYIAIGSLLVHMAGVIIVGTAHNYGQVVAGMAIGGAGAGVGELTGYSALGEIVPVKYRGYAVAFLGSFVLPFNPYLLYCELIATHSTWRWTMWMCLIIVGIGLVGIIFTYHPASHGRAGNMSRRSAAAQIDYIGGILSTVGLTIFLVALQAGGYTQPWKSAYVLCTLLIGAFTLFAWVLWEVKFAPYPMIPRELFTNRVVGVCFAVAFVGGMNFFSLINFFPNAFGNIYTPSPTKLGLMGLAYGFPITVGNMCTSFALSRFPRYNREIVLFACLLTTSFAGSLAVMNPTNQTLVLVLTVFTSFGAGGMLIGPSTMALIVVPDELLATTAALGLSIRTVGGSIGYSILYNIFATKLSSKLREGGPSDWANAYGMKYVFLSLIAFGTAATLMTLLLPNMRPYYTNRIATTLR